MERVQLEFPVADTAHRHALTVRVGDMNYGRHLGHDAVVAEPAVQYPGEAQAQQRGAA